MKKIKFFQPLSMLALMPLAFLVGCAPQEEVINLWTQEGTSEGAYEFVVSLAEAYMANNSEVTIEVLNKETEALREDFQNASLAGEAPELLWTVNDHAGPFVLAGIIQPVDGLVDLSRYVESVMLDGQTWGIPISSGNHLMLLYNRDLISNPPQDTDELLRIGSNLSSDGNYAIVWNQVEPFWLVPWLGGFNGRVFAADGVTPTLNTPEMINSLNFLYELKVAGITPEETDYAGADTLFKEGRSAMIINGDWSLGDYIDTLGDKLGIAPLPRVSQTGSFPAPYTSGKYFMIPVDVDGSTLDVVVSFIEFVTSYENQILLVQQLARLPALLEVLQDPVVVNDTILSGSSQQVATGTPMPSVIEMRCNWDAMKPEMNAVLAGTKTAEEAAAAMQDAAENCIATL